MNPGPYATITTTPAIALAWAAINASDTYREALLRLAEDDGDPEVVAAAQRIVARVGAQHGSGRRFL